MSRPREYSVSLGEVVRGDARLGPTVVTVRDGVVVGAEPSAPELNGFTATDELPSARVDLAYPDGILLPGLIDLHAHPARRGSVFGVEPDGAMLARGTMTVQSQGDAGADGVDEFLASTVNASQSRVLLALNLSRVGESTPGACFGDLAHADVDACVAAAAKYPRLIRMLAVNGSHHACGQTDPREVLRRGLLAAEQSGLPLLYGMRRPKDWPLAEQLSKLRPGDVVTYCFRREPHCIVKNGRVLPCVLDARQRGVLFDVGHGMNSFSFEVAETAIGEGFLPDTISTDLQNRHAGLTPQHDLPLVMSKLSAAGMCEIDLFRAVTTNPATALSLNGEVGSLEVGSPAEFVVLEREHDAVLIDPHELSRTGTRFHPRCVSTERWFTMM